MAELERRFKMTESVIRFLTVRIDLNLKRAEKIKSRRDSKKRLNTLSEDNNETQTVSVAVED